MPCHIAQSSAITFVASPMFVAMEPPLESLITAPIHTKPELLECAPSVLSLNSALFKGLHPINQLEIFLFAVEWIETNEPPKSS